MNSFKDLLNKTAMHRSRLCLYLLRVNESVKIKAYKNNPIQYQVKVDNMSGVIANVLGNFRTITAFQPYPK